MKLDLYADSISNLRFTVRVLLGAVAVLSLAIILLLGLYQKTTQKVRVILVPPGLVEPVFVGDQVVDKQYLLMMTRYVIGLVGSFTPETVEKQTAAFLELVHPDTYHKIKARLVKQAAVAREQHVVQSFLPENIKLTVLRGQTRAGFLKNREGVPPRGKVKVRGILIRRISTSPPVYEGRAELIFSYTFENGRFQVLSLSFKRIDRPSL